MNMTTLYIYWDLSESENLRFLSLHSAKEKKEPNVQSKTGCCMSGDPNNLASHLKILIPVVRSSVSLSLFDIISIFGK